MLKYKNDSDKAIEHMKAFWEGEIINRVCMAVFAPRKNRIEIGVEDDECLVKNPGYELIQGATPEFIVKSYNASMANTYYGGDALPIANAPGNLLYAAYGGKGTIKSDTMWVYPVISSFEDWSNYRFDFNNPWLQYALDITRALAGNCRGKYFVGSPGVFGAMDAMSTIRGMSDFLMELALEEYEEVLVNVHREFIKGFKAISDAIYDASESTQQEGTVIFAGLWAPDRINNWSADFSGLLGPSHYEKWVIPEIVDMARLYKYNMYHLDGPAAAKYLPMLLEIRELRGIAYERGVGQSIEDAMPVYKHIQQAGKLQFIYVDYREVECVLEELDPRGLFIITYAPDEETAEALLKNAEKISYRGGKL